MSDDYLKYVITEEVYVVNEEPSPSAYKEVEKKKIPNVEEPAIINEELVISGNKDAEVLILNFEETEQLIGEKDKQFLTNILKAVNLDFNNIGIINLQNAPDITIQQITDTKATIVLAFGIPADQVDLPTFERYTIKDIDQLKFMSADGLRNIEHDKNKKKKLWEVLQRLFLN